MASSSPWRASATSKKREPEPWSAGRDYLLAPMDRKQGQVDYEAEGSGAEILPVDRENYRIGDSCKRGKDQLEPWVGPSGRSMGKQELSFHRRSADALTFGRVRTQFIYYPSSIILPAFLLACLAQASEGLHRSHVNTVQASWLARKPSCARSWL